MSNEEILKVGNVVQSGDSEIQPIHDVDGKLCHTCLIVCEYPMIGITSNMCVVTNLEQHQLLRVCDTVQPETVKYFRNEVPVEYFELSPTGTQTLSIPLRAF